MLRSNLNTAETPTTPRPTPCISGMQLQNMKNSFMCLLGRSAKGNLHVAFEGEKKRLVQTTWKEDNHEALLPEPRSI